MRQWKGLVLSVALVGLGVGVLAASLIDTLWSSPWAPLASTAALWVGMLVPVVYAFTRGRPAGLLRFRGTDLIWGLALGIALRVLQGWVTDADAQPFPTGPLVEGRLAPTWLLTDAIPSGLIAPVVEEFFFRTVVLVAVYSLLRRAAGSFAAALGAVLVSTATFILIHAIDGSLPLTESISLGAVGLVCSLLVVLTGRIWGAVLVHIVYNTSMLLLIAAGSALTGP